MSVYADSIDSKDDFNEIANENTKKDNNETAQNPINFMDEEDGIDDGYEPSVVSGGSYKKESEEDFIKKRDYLVKLDTFKHQYGIKTSRNLNMNSNLQDIIFEYEKHKEYIFRKNSQEFGKKLILLCISMVEKFNEKLDPFGLDLEGWSQLVESNIEDNKAYDEAIGNIFKKYFPEGLGPEVTLLLLLGQSAYSVHSSNKRLKDRRKYAKTDTTEEKEQKKLQTPKHYNPSEILQSLNSKRTTLGNPKAKAESGSETESETDSDEYSDENSEEDEENSGESSSEDEEDSDDSESDSEDEKPKPKQQQPQQQTKPILTTKNNKKVISL